MAIKAILASHAYETGRNPFSSTVFHFESGLERAEGAWYGICVLKFPSRAADTTFGCGSSAKDHPHPLSVYSSHLCASPFHPPRAQRPITKISISGTDQWACHLDSLSFPISITHKIPCPQKPWCHSQKASMTSHIPDRTLFLLGNRLTLSSSLPFSPHPPQTLFLKPIPADLTTSSPRIPNQYGKLYPVLVGWSTDESIEQLDCSTGFQY